VSPLKTVLQGRCLYTGQTKNNAMKWTTLSMSELLNTDTGWQEWWNTTAIAALITLS